jgi:MarR family transcriptional regulator for hemolysin
VSAPVEEPIGLRLARTAKAASRAFDDALAEEGGSLPVWLVLMTLKGGRHAMQRELAASLGIEGATLTHHLNRMERAGLVTRHRDPANRRIQRVELTDAGDAAFARLLGRVVAFDQRLRAGLTDDELDTLRGLLARLDHNIATPTATEVTA